MLLDQRPWYFRKGDEIRKANYSVEARDLRALGYTRVDKDGNNLEFKPPVAKPKAEVKPAVEQKAEEPDFSGYTRAELAKFCSENKIEVKFGATKAELLKVCEGFVNG